MQVIIFKNTGFETGPFSAADWEGEKIQRHFNETFHEGTILVIKKSDFQVLTSRIDHGRMLNCGIKRPKIELFRALKFDQHNNKDLPRRIIADYATPGAFKRSFFRFFHHHYDPSRPPCILFVTDDRVNELMKLAGSQVKSPVGKDPISQLLAGIPKGDKMGDVYIGDSFVSRLTRSMIYKAARAESPVLILGESGTGKELLARLVYDYSLKYKKDFKPINCSSLPDELLESELFGHKKGSFTGASQDKVGLLEAANKGTVFLDEIGDLSLQNQAKLLRAIEEKEIRPVGSNETIKIEVRLIAATNRNLASMMKQKTFREDLYYRLNSLTIFAPPLREHPDDIPVIASAIWAKLEQPGKLSADFLSYLKAYSWPGNVRELKTILQAISDLFGGISPGPEHIEAIRAYQKKTLAESSAGEEDDFHHLIRAQSRNRIIEAQNILRDIKVALRPVIHDKFPGLEPEKQKETRELIILELERLENLCREPIFFRNRHLFDHIKRFRYLVDKSLGYLPHAPGELKRTWQTDLEPLHVSIDEEIYSLIWGKMDL